MHPVYWRLFVPRGALRERDTKNGRVYSCGEWPFHTNNSRQLWQSSFQTCRSVLVPWFFVSGIRASLGSCWLPRSCPLGWPRGTVGELGGVEWTLQTDHDTVKQSLSASRESATTLGWAVLWNRHLPKLAKNFALESYSVNLPSCRGSLFVGHQFLQALPILFLYFQPRSNKSIIIDACSILENIDGSRDSLRHDSSKSQIGSYLLTAVDQEPSSCLSMDHNMHALPANTVLAAFGNWVKQHGWICQSSYNLGEPTT